MGSIRSLVLMVLGLTHILSSTCYQQVPVLRLDNLTKTEVKYAKIYWKYNATARVVRIGEASKGEQNNLGYRFALPLPERMAGVTYVGHAARLRLVLERARRGERIRVGALGGSITAGQAVGGWQGSYVKIVAEWLNAALPKPPSMGGNRSSLASPPPRDNSRDALSVNSGSDGRWLGQHTEAAEGQGSASGTALEVDAERDLAQPRSTNRLENIARVMAVTAAAAAPGAAGRLEGWTGLHEHEPRGGGGGEGEGARHEEAQNHDSAVSRTHPQAGHMLLTFNGAEEAAGSWQVKVERAQGQAATATAAADPTEGAAALHHPRFDGGAAGSYRHSAVSFDPAGALNSMESMTVTGRASEARRNGVETRVVAEEGAGVASGAVGDSAAALAAEEEGHAPRDTAVGQVPAAKPASRAASPHAYIRQSEKQRAWHECFNGAVPGTKSSYMSSCLQQHLPAEVHLVFVEFAMNDPPAPQLFFTDPPRRAMERLIRKLLQLSSRPAVVLVNMFAVEAAHGNYLYNAERDYSELATYYGLPSVSLKAAVLPSAAVGATEQVSHGAIFNGGHNHPGRGGHVVAAELLITLCLDLLRSNIGGGAECDPSVATSSAGGGWAATAGATTLEAMEAVAARPLPPPLATGNYEAAETSCYIEHQLKVLVQQPVEGWNWTSEGRLKWGYVAWEPNRTIRIKVDTRLGGNRSEEEAAAPIVLQIAYLQTYERIGCAQVTCVEGCTCDPLTIDAFDRRPVSLTNMADIKVSQHPGCVVAITTMGPSEAAARAARDVAVKATAAVGGNRGNVDELDGWSKFKLMGVVVGEEPGASKGSVTFFRLESHDIMSAIRRTDGRGTG